MSQSNASPSGDSASALGGIRGAQRVAGLAAVIEPMGGTIWMMAMVAGWGVVAVTWAASRRHASGFANRLFVQPAE